MSMIRDSEFFVEKIRYIIAYTAQGSCSPKHVPELLTRNITALGGRSITEVLWNEGEEGWKKIESLIDQATDYYQDDIDEVPDIWK